MSWREVFFHSRISFKQIKQSSKHACLVLFSSFCATGAALNGGVHSHQVFAISSSQRVRGIESTHPRGLRHDKKSERAGCITSTQQDSTFQLIVGFKQYHQCRLFVDYVLINLWQCRMKINDVKSQLIKWQCRIDIVDLKLPQRRSDFNNTLSFDDSVNWSSATFKLVVVSNTIEYLKGSFKVSLGAFLSGATAFTTELIVKLTSEQSNHELTKLNSLVVHHKLIELINGLFGQIELTELKAHQPCPRWPHEFFSTRSSVLFQ